jgi:putative photosynthetic complex assembly protein 2
MGQYGYPVLYALFVWWFSTGLIIYLDNLPRQTFRWSLLGGTLVFAVSLHRLASGGSDTSVTGAYAAFTYGVLIWGWQEMSFFMGVVTGPRTIACPDGTGTWQRFRLALGTCLYHELAIVASAAAVVAVTWRAPNQVGLWTFVVLWLMRQSAKLNVFAGVLNLNEQFLPQHLRYLSSYMRRRPMNLLFPVSVTAATAVLVWLVQRATAPGVSAFDAAGLTFLATMLALAILEHWFMVLPLPFAELWSWFLRVRRHTAVPPNLARRLARETACPAVSVPTSR